MTGTARIATSQFGRIAVLRLGAPIVEHVHPHAHVLIKLSGPDGLFEVDGVNCPLRDDTVVLVDPWAPHAAPAAVSGSVTNILALNIALESDLDRRVAGRPTRQKVFGERCRELDDPLLIFSNGFPVPRRIEVAAQFFRFYSQICIIRADQR